MDSLSISKKKVALRSCKTKYAAPRKKRAVKKKRKKKDTWPGNQKNFPKIKVQDVGNEPFRNVPEPNRILQEIESLKTRGYRGPDISTKEKMRNRSQVRRELYLEGLARYTETCGLDPTPIRRHLEEVKAEHRRARLSLPH